MSPGIHSPRTTDPTRTFKDELMTRDIGKFLVKVTERRFPSKNLNNCGFFLPSIIAQRVIDAL